jgi:hypothetical protein
VLLDRVTPEMRDKLMLIWWKSWHHRNDIIFGKGEDSIFNFSRYLQNNLCTIHGSTLGTVHKDRNGKAPADFWVVKKATSTIQNSGNFDGWRRHEIGWVKWNVDAS